MNARTNSPGFSLIELVIVISLVGMIAGLFVGYLDEGTRMYEAVETRKELMMEARQAMIRTVREVRQVRSDTDVITADDSTFVFYGVNDSLFSIRFSGVPGEDLVFQRGQVTGTLAAAVDSFAFEFVQTDGTPAVPVVSPSSTDIYRVGLYLRMARDGQKIALRTGTFLRNI
jgi:prepilin-type N-terminal cleavage/methylation domain-containing protein